MEDGHQRGDDSVERAWSGSSEQCLELGEGLLDRIEAGAVGRGR